MPHHAHPVNAFTWPVRVYWEDTDAGGIVYYANYLKFCERARTEWLRARGIHQQALAQSTGCMFVVTDAQVHYQRSARLDDLLHVHTALIETGRSALRIAQHIHLASDEAPLLCRATLRAAWVRAADARAQRIPAHILQALA